MLLVAANVEATNTELAAINCLNFFSSSVLSLVFGFVNKKVPGHIIARIGIAIFILMCILLWIVSNKLWMLFVLSIIYGFTYSMFWVPLMNSVSKEGEGQTIYLCLFSFTWTIGQALGYIVGTFLFTKLGIGSALGFSIAIFIIVLIIYPCWEPHNKVAKFFSLKEDKEKEDKENKDKENKENKDNKDKDNKDKENKDKDKEEERKPVARMMWRMGPEERKRLRLRVFQYVFPAAFCAMACHGTVLTYGTQYLYTISGTEDGYFPTEKYDPSKYDIERTLVLESEVTCLAIFESAVLAGTADSKIECFDSISMAHMRSLPTLLSDKAGHVTAVSSLATIPGSLLAGRTGVPALFAGSLTTGKLCLWTTPA